MYIIYICLYMVCPESNENEIVTSSKAFAWGGMGKNHLGLGAKYTVELFSIAFSLSQRRNVWYYNTLLKYLVTGKMQASLEQRYATRKILCENGEQCIGNSQNFEDSVLASCPYRQCRSTDGTKSNSLLGYLYFQSLI